MMKFISGCVLTMAIAMPAVAQSTPPVPDVKGRWVGKTHSIIAGHGNHWPSAMGTFDKPTLGEKDLVMEVRGQDGRRFWGVSIISGAAEKTEEGFIGELFGKDNKRALIVDTNGYIWADLDGNDMSFCYGQADMMAKQSVVSCTDVKRQR